MPPNPTRRRLLAASALAATLPRGVAATPPVLTRPIARGGDALPVVGLGSWITFNVGADPAALARSTAVIDAFFTAGGRMIDCSPMYGSSAATIGHALARIGRPSALYSAEKVWTSDADRGAAQIEASRRLWGVERFDLMQVHNLLAWQDHLPRLIEMKAAGRLRHVGITTSEGRRHAEFERVMRTQPIDFVQFSYNPVDREAEQRLLPLALDRGIAVIVNRPFRQGELTERLAREPLPGWAAEIGCTSWAQVVLKFIVAHPAVSCAIPATSRVDHVRENVAAARGPLPDDTMRRRIAAAIARL